jgi:hypothetical protein
LSLICVATAQDPLAQDRAAVYRTFLEAWSKGAKGAIGLKRKTISLDLSEGNRKGCLAGIDLEPAPEAEEQSLPPKIAEGLNYYLDERDPLAGYSMGMNVSAIRFDRPHYFAVMTFHYVCGPLCGRGATFVFEKTDGQWTRTTRRCGSWVS